MKNKNRKSLPKLIMQYYRSGSRVEVKTKEKKEIIGKITYISPETESIAVQNDERNFMIKLIDIIGVETA